MVTAADIVSTARMYLGVPFRHQGRSPRFGVDCAGLVILTANALGLTDFDTADYGRVPDPARMRAVLESELDRIDVADIQPGDVLWMAFDKDPQHVAIVTDHGIIHAYSGVGKVVEHGLDTTWRRRIRGAYRFRGITCN